MGIINATNDLKFKSSDSLFAEVQEKLVSFDENGLIDPGKFHKYVKYIYTLLGQAVYRECEAVIQVKNFKVKLPDNFVNFHAAFRCTYEWRQTTSINEQRPWIFYTDTEYTKECPGKCELSCCDDNQGRTKVVIRTYVNGDSPAEYNFNNLSELILSSNVRGICEDTKSKVFSSRSNEITLDNGYGNVNFDEDFIYIQYFGLPVDDYGLPLIPDNEHVEKAIFYYIVVQELESLYLNSSVPNIATILQYFKNEYDKTYLPQALYWAKLPSFKRMIESLRRQRSGRKFFQYKSDRTIVS